MKRIFDLVASFIILLVLSPFLAAIAILIRVKLGSPILFKQARPGLHAEIFTIYKFRTMTDERNASGELLPDEKRLNGFGLFLRKYSLDELPQLLNVIRGELSMVGPRPLLVDYLPLYTPEQARRHEVKPGITGWGQVNGRNAITWDEKFEFDVWYVDHHSLWLDLRILLLTVGRVIRSENISQQGYATVQKYKGQNAQSC